MAVRGDCFSPPTPSGTCGSPCSLSRAVLPLEQGQADGSPAAVSRHLDGIHSFHSKPLQQTHLLPSECPLQPVEERGAPRAWLIPPAAVQLGPSAPRFSPLAIKKVLGTHLGVGIHAGKADEMDASL